MAKTKAKAKAKISAKSNLKTPAKPVKGKGAKLVAKKNVAKATPSKVTKGATKKSLAKAKPVAKKTILKVKPTAKKVVAAKPIKKDIIKPSSKKITPVPSKKTTSVAKVVSKRIESPTMMVGDKKIKLNFPKKRAGRKPKSKGDEDDGFELLDVPAPLPRTPRKSTKIFVPPVSQEVYVNKKVKLEKPPKNFGTFKMFELEYTIHASPHSIYTFISTPAGLSEWFADNVNLRNDEYTFFWDGSVQVATLISRKENTFIKFRWNDEPDFTFFEFKIVVDEITSDVAFLITDWAEDELSKEASTMLWNSQIEALMHVLGA